MPHKLKSSARRGRRNRKIGIIVGIAILALIIIGLVYVFMQPAPQFGLFVGVGGSGSTNVTGTQLYPVGTSIAVKATANPDWVLNDWLLNGTSAGATNPIVVTTSENRNLTAVFTQVPTSDKVLLETSMGNITIQLRDDKPNTAGNFKKLVEEGKYDGTIFHRVIADFMIQGGVINESLATIPDEIGSNNTNVRGTITMAKGQNPDSASSSFFINVVDNSGTKRFAGFDDTYTVFGEVIQGMDVVDAISKVTVGPNQQGENSVPLTDIILIRATILP